MASQYSTTPRYPDRSPDSSGSPPGPSKFAVLGFLLFAVSLAIAVYVFVVVQLLPPQDVWLASYIPIQGHYGEDQAALGMSYIQILEVSGSISFAGLFVFKFAKTRTPSFGRRLLVSATLPLEVFGALVASIVYVETHLLWGELWYNVKFAEVYPQGFPWGNERVASNLCFAHGSNYISSYGSYCWFFNYDELLLVSVAAALTGWVITYLLVGRETSG